jgi:hypothetical protein
MKVSFFGFLKRKKEKKSPESIKDRGILVFENTSDVIRTESLLKAEGWKIRVMGPPPEIRSGCDLVIEFPLMKKLNILRTLNKSKIKPVYIVPVEDPLLQPVDIFQIKDFGQHIMVRAANMKLTVEKNTNIIVNISGGGCPDVPYLAKEMLGKTLSEAPSPKDIGHTLCGYALQLAYEETTRIC